MPRWEVGYPQRQAHNRAMRIARHQRATLLPGDWFGVMKRPECWLYLGNDRYFGHGARQCFNLSGDIGPMSEVGALGKLKSRKNLIDAAHFLQLMK